MKLSERLIIISEEKVKLEYENKSLREQNIAWEQACKLREKLINDVLEDKKEIFAERHKLAMENIELEAYVHAAKRIFKGCGEYIYTYKDHFAIFNFDIEKVGLHRPVAKDGKVQVMSNKVNEDNDILDLFKQSSKDI